MIKKPRRKRISVWIVPLILAVSGIAGGGVWYLIHEANKVKGHLTDAVLANPESAAVVVSTFDETGEFVADGHALFHNADTPLVMASTMKAVVLAAYAEAVVSGDLDPGEQIAVADLEQYYLPLTDGGAHAMGLKSLGLRVDDHGFSRDPSAEILLDDVARIMIHYSGNAETDYLIARIGADRLTSVMKRAGLEQHTPIRLTIGAMLAMFNHELDSFSVDQLAPVIAEVSHGDTSTLDRLTALYLNDSQWRASQIAFMTAIRDQPVSDADMLGYQAEAVQLLPQGTAREYAKMMAQIASGTFISPEVSEIMQEKLESVPSDWPLRAIFFDRFGAKDGAAPGVLTLASYTVPKRGPLSDKSRVVVLIMNSLPLETWTEQLPYEGHYLLAIDLAQAAGEFDKLTRAGHEQGIQTGE